MINKYWLCKLILFFLLLNHISLCQNVTKIAKAVRTSNVPQIDGLLNDTVWQKATIISDFKQYLPIYNTKPSYETKVRILYDDYAIYISAYMYDNHPDSILKELGNRDDDDLNADAFGIQIDTYNNQLDGYSFEVTASCVQADSRENDESYNAVWKSEVSLNDSGWCAEIMIPYSAIRFPNTEIQTWGLELYRGIRRYRETDFWALEVPDAENNLVYWGKLEGLKNIKAPIRLSFTPYISIYEEHYPYNLKGKSNYSTIFSGGMDLKYGINESFTLDLTLLPDFSQVQSDNKVKNLTAFETIYDEQRPFFTEAVDLFNNGGLFYSRRIGGQPMYFNSIEDSLETGEYIKNNPEFSKLINSIKISGRNKNGLAIGLLNAITDKTYATIEDSVGNKRKLLTNPLTNYNIIVFDKEFKNNSSMYLINTNVEKGNKYLSSNVTGTGFMKEYFSNSYKINGDFAISQQYCSRDSIFSKDNLGYNYDIEISKIKGNFHFALSHNQMNSSYDDNALGLTLYNNFAANTLNLSYNIYEPFGKIRNMYNFLDFNYTYNNNTYNPTDNSISAHTQLTTLKYLTIWAGGSFSLINAYDYYEPRVEGRYYVNTPDYQIFAGFSPDYRKKFVVDVQLNYAGTINDTSKIYSADIHPIIRLNDKFSFDYEFNIEKYVNDKGFVKYFSENEIIFGNREVTTIENTLSGRYIFKNDLSLSLRIRHYYSKGIYNKHYLLNNDGYLDDYIFLGNIADFNFNSFNIDMVFSWQFAPGSSISIVWKNAILKDDEEIINSYFKNLNRTFNSPQLNSISLRILYYIDYKYIFKNRKKQL